MFSVIFEVFPKKERFEEYIALVKHLKPILDTIDGFVDNERFESKGDGVGFFHIQRGAMKSRLFAGAPRASTTRFRSGVAPKYFQTIT